MLTLLRWTLGVLSGWVLRLDPPVVCPVAPPEPSPLERKARSLVIWAETTYPDHGGEYKRHKVIAKLMKTFPSISPKDLAMAIEQAIQQERV